MARTLELFDESGAVPQATGDSVTLTDDGLLSYQGKRVQNIIGKWLLDNKPEEVFDNMRGWSNGYTSLREVNHDAM